MVRKQDEKGVSVPTRLRLVRWERWRRWSWICELSSRFVPFVERRLTDPLSLPFSCSRPARSWGLSSAAEELLRRSVRRLFFDVSSFLRARFAKLMNLAFSPFVFVADIHRATSSQTSSFFLVQAFGSTSAADQAGKEVDLAYVVESLGVRVLGSFGRGGRCW